MFPTINPARPLRVLRKDPEGTKVYIARNTMGRENTALSYFFLRIYIILSLSGYPSSLWTLCARVYRLLSIYI